MKRRATQAQLNGFASKGVGVDALLEQIAETPKSAVRELP
jgi:hypothetical protein